MVGFVIERCYLFFLGWVIIYIFSPADTILWDGVCRGSCTRKERAIAVHVAVRSSYILDVNL
ncbi:hypothetical protein D9M71_358970 [compost metagenome]